ncbi:hypothetical protein FPRO05_00096 [Fusarium proliferatum]|uniref:F-box domain-containing protein n=1 Tax=Gibberella intermedia TaxID=948311 RepID=A0A365NLN2_GIBIN|nr:hypothetical protein FPRO05_00096 [Fusarium proliferatum]
MTPQLPHPIPGGIDHFGDLPLELNVQIMELLPLDDLCSLTRAPPAAWRSFRLDHSFILKPHVNQFYDHYGDPAAAPLLKPLVAATETLLPSDLRPWGLLEEIMESTMTQISWTDKRPYIPTEFNFEAPKYFRKWFEPIVKTVDKSLRKEWGRTIKGRKKQSLTVEESEIKQFLQRKGSEDKHLCYHLTLQGNTLLNHLIALTPQALNAYILDTYLSIIDS